MSKILKYTLGILAVALLIYLSLDIQNLEKHRNGIKPAGFNPTNYSMKFWNDSLPYCIANAPEIGDLLKLLGEDPTSAFEKYGKKLGISTTYYFIAKGEGTIEKVDDEFLVLTLDDENRIKIATDFIFGNAVRDGSGKVDIDDFLNMTDFNNVSVAINKLVKERVVSHLQKSAAVDKKLEFAGAMEISEKNIDLSKVLLIPVFVSLSNGKSE